jgi:hypothetical protein
MFRKNECPRCTFDGHPLKSNLCENFWSIFINSIPLGNSMLEVGVAKIAQGKRIFNLG